MPKSSAIRTLSRARSGSPCLTPRDIYIVVNEWADKWNEREVISTEVSDWVRAVNPKPALIYANVKTHKENWPYRYIMSARGTAMEKLAKWIEIQLKPFAQIHAAYIRDTLSFLQHLEKLNEK